MKKTKSIGSRNSSFACLNNTAGITLIALVITIIVLLILAGISISMILGNNGVINQASGSVTQTRIATVKEEISLAWTSCYNDYFAAWSNDFTKQKSEFFTQTKLGQYLEGKGDVLYLAYNPNGASKVVYESDEDNLVYRLKIHSSDKVTLIKEPDTDETIRLADKITAYNYGDSVTNYTVSNGVNDWKIFYTDDTHVFLISSDYVPNNTINTTATGMTQVDGSSYNAYWTSTPSDFQVTEQLNLFRAGVTDGYTLDYNYASSKMVATLLNENKWTSFIDQNGYGKYATGGPTIEMWIKSWNEKYNDALAWEIGTADDGNNYGYIVGENTSDLVYSLTISSKKGWTDAKNNGGNVYFPHTGDVQNEGVFTRGYWLASPGAYEGDDVMHVYCNNFAVIGAQNYTETSFAVRPVIAISSDVLGDLIEETGSWTLSK